MKTAMRSSGPPLDVNDLAVAAAEFSLNGEWLGCNREFSILLGLSREELVLNLTQWFRPDDEHQWDFDRKRMINGETNSYSSMGTITRKDGSTFPARVVFSGIKEKTSNELMALLATVDDLTALRKSEHAFLEAESARVALARRLIKDQETERSRIARELHDDISQSLAILCIQFLRAGEPVSGMAGAVHPSVPELCEDLRQVATRVSRLSHRLHSSKLEYLGLARAVQGHCREFSEQYKLTVDCVCKDLPKEIDGQLGTTLLRIVQEALHNVAKHSKAKNVHVSMQGSENDLSLVIEDDGIGFDLHEARFGAGLGLISMGERAHLAGGDFRISSEPGKGTLIIAQVPLNKTPLLMYPVLANAI